MFSEGTITASNVSKRRTTGDRRRFGALLGKESATWRVTSRHPFARQWGRERGRRADDRARHHRHSQVISHHAGSGPVGCGAGAH